MDDRPHYIRPIESLTRSDCETLIELSLAEDLPDGDATSDPLFTDDSVKEAHVVAREPGVLAGLPVISFLCDIYSEHYAPLAPLIVQPDRKDGTSFAAGERLLSISGAVRDILRLERTMLNFIQYLSGIATTVERTVKLLPDRVVLLDTRKTLPGYRKLAKYAVYHGGGTNHRLNLSEMAMIKDNHIAAAGSIAVAVEKVRVARPGIKLEIEVDRLDQLTEALSQNPEIVLLDNMDVSQVARALRICEDAGSGAFIELSGNWKPERCAELSGLSLKRPIGVSMGFITHTTRFLDLSLEIASGYS